MKCIVCLFLFLNVSGQDFQVTDNKSTPVPFANLLFYDGNKIVKADYTDQNGYYTFRDTLQFDEVVISCIGYDSLRVKKDELQSLIALTPKLYTLDEVVITKNTKTKTYGFVDGKPAVKIGIGKGIEVVLFIENKDSTERFIKTFLFNIQKPQRLLYDCIFTVKL